MLKKITPISLSLALLLYPLAMSQAHSNNVFPNGDNAVSTPMPEPSTGAEAKTSVSPPKNTGSAVGVRAPKPPKVSGNRPVGRRGEGTTRGGKSRWTRPPAATNPNATRPVGREAHKAIMERVIRNYEAQAGPLIIRSAYRDPAAQSRAMYNLIRMYGVRYVTTLYRRRAAVYEILRAYKANRKRRGGAVTAMTRVIQAQVARGVYISRHMLGRAFDVRSRGRDGANLAILRKVVKQAGGRVVVERNHYHVEV